MVDTRRTRFGVRTVTMDAVNGLRLNGEPMELRGGNVHHDNYMLGAAGFPDADRRKVALMKAAGYNAIRSAHNPASQATLDAADNDRLRSAQRFHSVVLLKLLDELSRHIVNAHTLAPRARRSIEKHSISHSTAVDPCLWSNSDELSLLLRQRDRPVLRTADPNGPISAFTMRRLGRTFSSATAVDDPPASAEFRVGNVLAPLECKLAPFF